MVDVSRIGGLPDPQRPDAARSDASRRRVRSTEAEAAANEDGVAISAEARRAAEALRFASFARSEADVRQERVDAARERLERGDLDQPETVQRAVGRLLDDLA